MELRKKLFIITLVSVAAIAGFVIIKENNSFSPLVTNLQPIEPTPTREPAETQEHVVDAVASTEPEVNIESDDLSEIELVRSLYDADRDFREAAIAEADRFVLANFGRDRGFLRWESVWIEPNDLIVGDLSLQDAIAKEFQISIFSGVSYKATETAYHPLDVNNAASWRGVLDGGESGTVEMSIMKGDDEASLIIRMRGPAGYFLIVQTEMPNVYVAAEADLAYRRSMKTE